MKEEKQYVHNIFTTNLMWHVVTYLLLLVGKKVISVMNLN